MTTTTSYDSTRESLQDILRDINEGKTQLPDFQRGWIWDDDHIRSLLASLSLSYPIGAVMLLETGNPQVRFHPRPVEGVELNRNRKVEPERLILDGQQRLTSLFQALFVESPVHTRDYRKKPITRHYYIDIAKAISTNGDREDSIIALPEDRIVRNFRNEPLHDYSTPEKEYEAGMFPLYRVFGCFKWRTEYNKFWNYQREKLELFGNFEEEILERFKQYQVPIIVLKKPTPKVAVCQVFEKVNTGGVTLTVFELMTASFAVEEFSLRDDWQDRQKRLQENKILQKVTSSDYLQVIALLATLFRREKAIENNIEPKDLPGISCKRKAILGLTLDEYKLWAEPVTLAFKEVAKFLHVQKIFTSRDIPYRTQIVPLAAIFAVLGKNAENYGVLAKIAQWYWCGVFGELYGGATETRFARDLPEVVSWVNDGGEEPITVVDANFVPVRLLTLRTRNSAAYKGIYSLLLRDSALDFRSGVPVDIQTYFDESIDIHHIFPKVWCKQNGIDGKICDCIVNKTPLSARTNRIIGGNAPSDYLPRLQRNAEIDDARMAEILASHVIDSSTLRADDFEFFFQARQDALLDRIEAAMGKPIAREVTEETELDTNLEEHESDDTEDAE